jgi:hypothetical protein
LIPLTTEVQWDNEPGEAKGGAMSQCKPYGDPKRACVMVIGHDPRLQNSNTEASCAFFLDYLDKQPRSNKASEKRKCELAKAVVSYVRYLVGASLPLEDMYFTNLCNTFLDRSISKGTVLIPNELANRGVEEIEKAISRGSFKVILVMAPQVFYHLIRTGFVADSNKNLERSFSPSPSAIEKRDYKPSSKSPFLKVCGEIYHHRNDSIPIIPILHVKQWPLNAKMEPHYGSLMCNAAKNARCCLDLEV